MIKQKDKALEYLKERTKRNVVLSDNHLYYKKEDVLHALKLKERDMNRLFLATINQEILPLVSLDGCSNGWESTIQILNNIKQKVMDWMETN